VQHAKCKQEPAALSAVVTMAPVDWIEIPWRDVRVGDIIRLKNDDPVPADIIVLSSSEDDCICFVETKNLDGETNLKVRQGPVDTSWIRTAADCEKRLRLVLESEQPSTNMLRYQASLTIHPVPESVSGNDKSETSPRSDTPASTVSGQQGPKKVPVDINGILLRGSVVRNTSWVIGVVIFTGVHTKQVMNTGKTPSKRSEIDKMMNPHV
jgi:phospholipid-translocating ATPase